MKSAITFDDLNPSYVPYSTLNELLRVLGEANVQSTLFVIPHGLSSSRDRGDYLRLLRNAKALGHEIALHGYRHTGNEFGYMVPIPFPELETQMSLLRMGHHFLKVHFGEYPVGFRAPNYRHSAVTLHALARFGFMYDSSKTVFKPTHGMRFRFRTGIAPRVTKTGPICEIPVTGDYGYNIDKTSFNKHLQRAEADFKWVKQIGGAFVANNHVGPWGPIGLQFLRALIDDLHDETDFFVLRDLTL
jgi:peptidoglycan/xylan/chitin deacetylase (PgdA/CDA1 family)